MRQIGHTTSSMNILTYFKPFDYMSCGVCFRRQSYGVQSSTLVLRDCFGKRKYNLFGLQVKRTRQKLLEENLTLDLFSLKFWNKHVYKKAHANSFLNPQKIYLYLKAKSILPSIIALYKSVLRRCQQKQPKLRQ